MVNEGKLIFYDRDDCYRGRMAEYIRKRKRLPFQLVVFSKEELLLNELEKDMQYLCLIPAADLSDAIRQKAVGKLVVLQDGTFFTPEASMLWINKYQSAKEILSEVIKCYEERYPPIQVLMGGGRRASLIGIYSPVSRCGKTTFAMLYAMNVAKKAKTLFLCTDEYSGLSELLEERNGRNVGDLICMYKEKPEGLTSFLREIRQRVGELDFILPIADARELCCISGKEWEKFFLQLVNCGEYEYVVLDIGNVVAEIFGVLEQCEKIYQPMLREKYAEIKLREWETFVYKTGKEELLENRELVYMPIWRVPVSHNYFQTLLASEVGDYVRNVMRGG
ncbi:MAG: hypothetical protein E7269_07225 [Lachnospiraceae bacterium]|nr:hypothetical protein [Lachnospiraceae bacterium]